MTQYKTFLEMVQGNEALQKDMYQNYRAYMIRKCHPRDVTDELMSFSQWQAHLGLVPVHMQYITEDQ